MVKKVHFRCFLLHQPSPAELLFSLDSPHSWFSTVSLIFHLFSLIYSCTSAKESVAQVIVSSIPQQWVQQFSCFLVPFLLLPQCHKLPVPHFFPTSDTLSNPSVVSASPLARSFSLTDKRKVFLSTTIWRVCAEANEVAVVGNQRFPLVLLSYFLTWQAS